MFDKQFSRTEILIGKEGMKRLRNAKVAVFGIGGVGGYVVEALARSGIGALDIVDNDKISPSNLNRQIIALRSTLGQYKVDAARERIADIDPEIEVRCYKTFYVPEIAHQFRFEAYDYVVDAIDTVAGKLSLVEQSKKAQVPVISSMGAGNKLNAADFQVADIYETSVCPLARVMRKELRNRGIDSLKVVYSKEAPVKCEQSEEQEEEAKGKRIPGSISFVPPAAGLIMAGEVIKDLISL